MVRRPLLLGLLAAWAVAVAPPPLAAQQRPAVQVGVRPRSVRVGESFIVTVTVRGAAPEDSIALASTSAAEVVDIHDQSSTDVGSRGGDVLRERNFVLRALAPGRVSPARVSVAHAGDTVRAAVPDVEAVASPIDWPKPATAPRARTPDDEPPVLDQGHPPQAFGRDAVRSNPPWDLAAPGASGVVPGASGYLPGYPSGYGPGTGYGSGAAYGSGVGSGYAPGYSPYTPSGWGMSPPGGSWAATADQDPWWPELIPRLERYDSRAEGPDGIVWLQAGLTPRRVYVGQQVTVVTTASFAPEAVAQLARSPEYFPPSAADAWAVEIPYAPPVPAAAGGRLEEAHTFMRAFFPLAPGRLDIAPPSLRYGIRSPGSRRGGRGSARDSLVTRPLQVDVLPVPLGRAPQGWNGAVGRYRVTAWLQPDTVGWGEASLLTVQISGAGNVRAISRPDPGAVWGAQLRPTGARSDVEVRDGVVGGTKTFSWLVVPTETGDLRIGPVVFTYFDPWVGDFGRVASDELTLSVGAWPGGGAGSPGSSGAFPTGTGSGAPSLSADTATAGETPRPALSGARPSGSSRAATGIAPPDSTDGAGKAAGGASGSLPAAPPLRPGWPSSAGPETRAEQLARAVARDPGDPQAWLALGKAYATARPGEGWAEWAFYNGLRRAPRNRGLRAAVHSTASWRASPGSGLARLPLSRGESLAGALALLLGGLGAGALGGRRARRGASRASSAVWLVLSGALLLCSLGTLEPWWTLGRQDAWGVSVEGPALLRLAPSWSAPDVASVPDGTVMRLGPRYGSWVRVTSPGDGVAGWVEDAQVAPLGPVRPGGTTASAVDVRRPADSLSAP